MCAQRRQPKRPNPRQRGYTLLELMIVVSIVAIVMAAAGGAFGTAFADRRTSDATDDIVRLGRQAYMETLAYHRAHVVSFTGMTGTTPGRVELIRGNNNSCGQDWVTLRALAACGNLDSRCIDWAELSDSEYLASGRGPRVRSGALPSLALCYQPDGTVAHATTLAGPYLETNLDASNNSLQGGYRLSVQSYHPDKGAEGVARNILFPLGGMPRRQR